MEGYLVNNITIGGHCINIFINDHTCKGEMQDMPRDKSMKGMICVAYMLDNDQKQG